VAQGPLCSLNIAKLLAEKLSKTLQVKDARGMLPVHIAAASDAPLGVLYYDYNGQNRSAAALLLLVAAPSPAFTVRASARGRARLAEPTTATTT
jgi:hypothetical protein